MSFNSLSFCFFGLFCFFTLLLFFPPEPSILLTTLLTLELARRHGKEMATKLLRKLVKKIVRHTLIFLAIYILFSVHFLHLSKCLVFDYFRIATRNYKNTNLAMLLF